MLVVKRESTTEDRTGGGEPPDLVALVQAAGDGDRPAMGQLYQLYRRMVHGLALAQLPPAEAEDVVHEVFLQAMRKLDTLREPEAFGPWLATIARNWIVNRHRARRLRGETAGAALEAVPDGAPAAGPGMLEAQAILAAIQELPMAYREPLVLRLVEGMTGPEIAERTGLAPASVRVNLHRGLHKLREVLAAREEDRQ